MRIDLYRRNAKLIRLCIAIMFDKIIDPQQVGLIRIISYRPPFGGQHACMVGRVSQRRQCANNKAQQQNRNTYKTCRTATPPAGASVRQPVSEHDADPSSFCIIQRVL